MLVGSRGPAKASRSADAASADQHHHRADDRDKPVVDVEPVTLSASNRLDR
jgi:hypothetical protein